MEGNRHICFFNTTKFWGGGEKWHFEAAKRMTETESQVFFVAGSESEIEKKLKEINIHPFTISVNNRSFLNPIKVKKLVQFYKNNKIDTVIFNSPKDLKLGGKAAKKAGVKNIVYRRGIAVEIKKSALNEKLFKEIVTHFIFNSEATKKLAEKNHKAIIETKKSSVIYNAIKPYPIQSQKQQEVFTIGNAGRLVEQKGQSILIALAKTLKERGLAFKIKIAGEGPLFNELKQAINKEGLEKEVFLLGFVNNMQGFMQQIDVFVSTALWEGFGFVLAESMMVKKPVVAFDLSSNPELVKDGVNGFLIPENDVKSLADKIELLYQNQALRTKMGEASYAFARDNFDVEKQFQKLVNFLSI